MSCGGHCQCAGNSEERKKEICAMPKDGIVLDKDGKCPCGKTKDECCHKQSLASGTENAAVEELCAADTKICE